MPTHHSTEPALTPQLEAIATAAAELLRAQCDDDTADLAQLHARVRDAASTAIASGAELDALAPAQQIGQNRARQQLSKDVLRAVARAAKTKRDTDAAYEHAIRRAGRLGLSHREIATEAQVSHGTVRAILAHSTTSPNGDNPQTADEAPAATGETTR